MLLLSRCQRSESGSLPSPSDGRPLLAMDAEHALQTFPRVRGLRKVQKRRRRRLYQQLVEGRSVDTGPQLKESEALLPQQSPTPSPKVAQ